MTRVVRSEWTKLFSLRSTGGLLVALVAATIALSTMVVASQNRKFCPTGCDPDLVLLSLVGVYIGQIAVVVLAVLAVTAEYSTGTIAPTLAAIPRRGTAVAAKTLVVLASVLIAGAAAVLGAFAAGRVILPRRGFDALSLTDVATLRATGGTVLYLGLIALLSLGLGYAIRDTAGTITTMLGLLFVMPILAMIVNREEWRLWILRLSPMTAGLSIQATRHLEALPLQPWPGLGVLGAYAAAAMALGALLFLRRDA